MKKNNLNNNIGYESPTVLNWLAVRTNAPILADSKVKTSVSVKTGGQELDEIDYSNDFKNEDWD